jgi:transposase
MLQHEATRKKQAGVGEVAEAGERAGAERVRAVIGEDPRSGHLFVFRWRRGDRLKILHWDRDGFVLWYKRLEEGVFKLPRAEGAGRALELRASEMAMILDGIDVSRLQRLPRYERGAG